MKLFFEVSDMDNCSASVSQKTVGKLKCPVCGNERSEEAYYGAQISVNAYKRDWPDEMTSIGHLVLREDVCEAMEDAGITGYIAHPVGIFNVGAGPLFKKWPGPQYYLIEATGRIDVDLNELDDEGGSACHVCFTRRPREDGPYRWAPKRTVPVMSTWDGSDILKVRNSAGSGIYCTPRFIELARIKEWKNYRFGSREGMPGVGLWWDVEEGRISYKDADWYPRIVKRAQEVHPDLGYEE